MKNYNILFIIIGILAGLAIGYFLFNKTSTQENGSAAAPIEAETTYTCSMHPQIRQDEPGRCPICEMDLIPVGENTSTDPLVLEMTPEAVKLAHIQTTAVEVAERTAKQLQLSGKIQEDERRAASLVAHLPGRIEQLFVTFTGEQVNKGQKLATVYAPELIAAQGEYLEALRLQDVQPGLVEAARKKLKTWKIADEMIRQLEENQTVQETFTVHADVAGIVKNRKIAVGDYVQQGEVLFDLIRLDQLWVLFDAYEEDLAHINKGDRIVFTTPSLPDRAFTTRITFIDPVIDPVTRVAALRAEVNNSGGLLKPEMFVKGRLESPVRTASRLSIPRSAVLWTGRRSVVYLKVPGASVPSFEYREVVLGEAVGDDYLVLEGLQEGDEVVTQGSFTIDAAAQLNNQQSMMNKVVQVKGQLDSGLPDYKADTPVAFKTQLRNLIGSYTGLKDALVETDPAKATAQAEALLSTIKELDDRMLEGAPSDDWKEMKEGLQFHTQNISTAQKVEKQRKQFEFVSDLLIKAVQVFGIEGPQVYLQHCPMAFDWKGADWLSLEEEIMNPYFGDKMLHCGTVEEVFQ